VVMRFADGEADHVASKVVLRVGRGPGRFQRLHQRKRDRSRLRTALQPSPLVDWLEGSRSRLVACLFRATTVGSLRSDAMGGGAHEAKRGRGRLRDGGALKVNMCFFPVKG
jgi:hypothetical protein